MRPVALRHIVTTIAVILAVSACGSTAASTAAKPMVSQPSATAATVPGSNSAGTCDENTVPAFAPDFSKRGPLPGGGRTAKELWVKVKALYEYAENPRRVIYSPSEEYGKGLPFGDFVTEQPGVICPNGNVYITGRPVPIITHGQFENTTPNGRPPYYLGGRLYVHSARDAIGDQPCLAIVEIDEQYGETTPQQAAADGNVYVACTNNGSFWYHLTLD